jgi:hypothetical protein
LSSTCVLCTLCCQCLRIVHFWLHLVYSLMFVVLDLCPVYPMLPVFQDCPFLIAPCVFSNVCCPWLVSCVPYVTSFSGSSISDCSFGIIYCLLSSTCVLCTLCCQCLRIVHFWLLLVYSLMFVFLDLCPVYPMLPVSQDCPFLIACSVFSNVCCPRLVSCVPYVTSVSGLSISDCLFGIL